MSKRQRVRTIPIVLAVALASSWPTAVHVGNAADNAQQIIEESQRRTDSKSERYVGFLQTTDATGKTTDKGWTFTRLGAHGQARSVIRFTMPPEVKGVALLIVNHSDRASDQWMWTPSLERDRRIALQDRSTRFFGTDFTFEDLEERDLDQFDYTLLGEESVNSASCWKIRSVPKQSKTSQYTQSVVWIRKDIYAFIRIESYVKDRVVRRLDYSEIRQIQGIWTAAVLTMADLGRNSTTRLTLSDIVYNTPLKDEDFTLQAIRRP